MLPYIIYKGGDWLWARHLRLQPIINRLNFENSFVTTVRELLYSSFLVAQDELDDHEPSFTYRSFHRHKEAFYNAINNLDSNKHFNKRLMDEKKYDYITSLLKRHNRGTTIAELRREGHLQIDKYLQKYILHSFEVDGDVLLEMPLKNPDGSSTPLDQSRRVLCYENLFDGLKEIHGHDHPKGLTMYHRVAGRYCNVPRSACKLFTETCPRCIEKVDRRSTTAGHQPILTHGFGSRGQIDLIDFQNMPDGQFKFLMNYLDHGTKIAYSSPLVSKRAGAVACVLIDIFTIFGPPSILQADNGREFFGAASVYHHVVLSNEVSIFFVISKWKSKSYLLFYQFMDEVISEVKALWPECRMVTVSPRRSSTNGGVERLNRTLEVKLGSWVRDNNSARWSIGCKMTCWQYNTQVHRTIGLKYLIMLHLGNYHAVVYQPVIVSWPFR